MNSEREVGEKFSPVGLAIGQFGHMAENFKVLMIREDLELMGTSFKVMSPFTKGFDNGEKFSVVDIVVPFGFNE